MPRAIADTDVESFQRHGFVVVERFLERDELAAARAEVDSLFPSGRDSLYAVGFRTGVLSATDGRGRWRELARGLGSPDGIDAAPGGGFYASDNAGGNLFLVRPEPGATPVKIASGLEAPADLLVDQKRGLLVVPETSGNRLTVYQLSAR